MALTNAQIQARYRASRPYADDGEGNRRLTAWVPTSAAFALQRLARFYALSQQDALVRIINAAVDSLTAGMSDAERDQL